MRNEAIAAYKSFVERAPMSLQQAVLYARGRIAALDGVASVADAYMHIARYNYYYPDVALGVASNCGRSPARRAFASGYGLGLTTAPRRRR